MWDVLKKALAMVLVLLLAAVCPGRLTVKAQDAPSVSAKAAVVLCADNGEVLYSKNSEERLSMASTTKIMTALITLEEAQVENRQVTITQEMVAVEGSSMGLRAGNVVTLDTLAKGMLLSSGNDAANAAALAISGSQEAFAQRMNDKAAQIGMENTNFVTPSGLDAEQHYSTAYDMALLARAVLEREELRRIVGTKTLNVAGRYLANHNKLLWRYEGCTGLKTGYTDEAGRTLVSSAMRDGQELIAVTLNDPNDWTDHAALFDYGFARYPRRLAAGPQESWSLPVTNSLCPMVTAGVTEEVYYPLAEGEELTARVQLPQQVEAPVTAGSLAGELVLSLEQEPVLRVPLVYQTAVADDRAPQGWLQRFLSK